MDVLTHSRYLSGFATPDELKAWSPAVRAALVVRLTQGFACEAAWGAFVELLIHWPTGESIEPVVKCAAPLLRQWDWRLRPLEHSDPVLRRDGGIAMSLAGQLIVQDLADLHGHTLRGVCSHPHLDGLRGLQLRKIETFGQHVGAVVSCQALAGLEALELSKVQLSGGIAEAFGSSRLAALTTLALRSADLNGADLEALVRHPPSAVVKRLDLSGNHINNRDLGALMAADSYPRLELLDLSDTFVHDAGLLEIVAHRRLSALRKIMLYGTPAAKHLGPEMQV
jgi:hypothetical protein